MATSLALSGKEGQIFNPRSNTVFPLIEAGSVIQAGCLIETRQIRARMSDDNADVEYDD